MTTSRRFSNSVIALLAYWAATEELFVAHAFVTPSSHLTPKAAVSTSPLLRRAPVTPPSREYGGADDCSSRLNVAFGTPAEIPANGYDLILVGSGNGACGFLANCLDNLPADANVLVIEQGKNFFDTSDITHQNSWTKSYSEGSIFSLHNTRKPNGAPIISGKARSMGGGGSINYTMIHESSKWLKEKMGFTEAYWDQLKSDLNLRFDRQNPADYPTPQTTNIINAGVATGFEAPNPSFMSNNIPSYYDQDKSQLYQFPTQFNTFGQRTNSGVSLIDWKDSRVNIQTRTSVDGLTIEETILKTWADGVTYEETKGRCTSVQTTNLDTGATESYPLSSTGKVIMCAGAATPRMLLDYKTMLSNDAIGKSVNDHICLVMGLYLPQDNTKIYGKDIYGPVFGTSVVKAPTAAAGEQQEEDTVVSMDFFTGTLQKQLYMTSHLFLSFLPNWIKSPMLNNRFLFFLTKNLVRTLVSILNIFISLKTPSDPEFVTAIIKYNAAKTGEYVTTNNGITLNWFDTTAKRDPDDVTSFPDSSRDADVAREALKTTGLPMLKNLGEEPGLQLRLLYSALTGVPYTTLQVNGYVKSYSENKLLSEQHLAGGCIFKDALETGESNSADTGRLKGSTNIHVADLSAVPLPRVSPQMTAYLVGYHVAQQLYATA